MVVAAPEWDEVLCDLAEVTAGAPLLMYGSRAPRWPDAALPSSDYDLIMVREGAPPQQRMIDLRSKLRADVTILSRRAVQNSRLMSPQQHVADRWGERIGDWTCYDLDRPLSWLGADATLETLQCEAEVALEAHDDAPWLCGLGIRALRRGLTLLYAVGVLGDAAPTWALTEERYSHARFKMTGSRAGQGWRRRRTPMRGWRRTGSSRDRWFSAADVRMSTGWWVDE